jgi:hypothetical protein
VTLSLSIHLVSLRIFCVGACVFDLLLYDIYCFVVFYVSLVDVCFYLPIRNVAFVVLLLALRVYALTCTLS